MHRDASLVCLRGEDVVLAARDAEPVVRAITAAADRRRPSRSASATSTTDFGTATSQAVACARLAPAARPAACVRAQRLGPLRFLLDAPDVSQVRAVVNEQLGPLLAHEGGRADLLATLRAFVAADGNVAETAQACFMHKNTLRYRLKRLTEVLGRDPAEPDAKFHLRMAFDLVDLFAGMGIDVLPPTARGSWGTAAGGRPVASEPARPARRPSKT